MKDVRQVLLEGLEKVTQTEEFTVKSQSVLGEAFERIIADTERCFLVWKRTARGMMGEPDLECTASVFNASGACVSIPVYFYTVSDANGTVTYLSLGAQDGLRRTDLEDTRLKAIAKCLFG